MPANNTDAVKIEELREMGHRNTICEAVINVKDALNVAYPNATFFIVASDMHLDPLTGMPRKYRIATKSGTQRDLSIETTDISAETPWLADTCVETALNIIVSHTPQQIVAKEAALLHDAALDYARYNKLSIAGHEYCRDSAKWRDRLKPATVPDASPSGQVVHKIGQRVQPWDLEQHITQVRQELRRLEAMRDPSTQSRMIADEIKRLKRKGELTAAKVLQDQLEAHQADQAHQQAVRQKRIESLVTARAALAAKREAERKRKSQQHQQPNFAKMAKQRRQQITARQAEKKKKKSSSSGGAGSMKSCSQLLNS